MIAEETVLYLRFILLLIQGGGELLRKITEKALTKMKTALCPFLSSVKSTLMGSKDLHEKQKELLFPSSSAIPDIKDFDITLLSFIILHCFQDVLDGNERNAARQIRDLRNKYHAHAGTLNMTLATFTKEWTKIATIIYSVAHGMSDKDKQELLDILDNVNDDQFRLKTAIEELKKIDTSNDFYGTIKEKLEEIEICQKEIATDVKDIKKQQMKHGTMIEVIHEGILEMREEVLAIKRQLENQGKITTVKSITYGKVHANADDQETTEEAESRLFRASNESIAKAETKEYSQSELKEKTDGFIKDVENLGVKVTGIKEGSVVFEFTCSSLDALIDLLDYFCSSRLRARLDDIAMALEHVVGKKVDLLGFIDLESIQNVIEKLHHLEHERIVQFEMECAGVDGLLHVLDVFEEDKAANSLNELSKALSETVKKPVTLYTSVDKDQMQRAIDSLKEHIALEYAYEIDRGSESCSADNGLEDRINNTFKQTDKEFPDESMEADLPEPYKNGKSLAEAKLTFPGTKKVLLAHRPKEILSESPEDQHVFKEMSENLATQETVNWTKCTVGLKIVKMSLIDYIRRTWKEFLWTFTADELKHLPDFFDNVVDNNCIQFDLQQKCWTLTLNHDVYQSIFRRILHNFREQKRNSRNIVWNPNDKKTSRFKPRELQRIKTFCRRCRLCSKIQCKYEAERRGYDLCRENDDRVSKVVRFPCKNETALEEIIEKYYWRIANMFMFSGRERCSQESTCPADTDPTLLFKMMNCCNLFIHDDQLHDEILEVIKGLMHSPNQRVSEEDFDFCMETFNNVLTTFDKDSAQCRHGKLEIQKLNNALLASTLVNGQDCDLIKEALEIQQYANTYEIHVVGRLAHSKYMLKGIQEAISSKIEKKNWTYDADNKRKEDKDEPAEAGGVLQSAATGASVGATVGAFGGPVGAAVGGVAGATGGMVGSLIGRIFR